MLLTLPVGKPVFWGLQDQRRFILDNQGQDLPLGLLLGNWPSSELLTEITLILLEEVLGCLAQNDFFSAENCCRVET